MEVENRVIVPEKLKDVLITKTAIKTLQSERTVERVISFQFQDAKLATLTKREVEISGFGTFRISKNKIIRKINRLERNLSLHVANFFEEADEAKKAVYQQRIEFVNTSLDILKTRLREYEN